MRLIKSDLNRQKLESQIKNSKRNMISYHDMRERNNLSVRKCREKLRMRRKGMIYE